MRNRTLLVIGVLAVFFVLLAGRVWNMERRIANDKPVYLALAPRDPRELFLGDYMELNYSINSEIDKVLHATQDKTTQNMAIVSVNEQGVLSFMRMADGTPLEKDEMFLRFKRSSWRVEAAPSRFYFEEGTAADYEKAKFGEFRLNADGALLIVALCTEPGKRIVPSPAISQEEVQQQTGVVE